MCSSVTVPGGTDTCTFPCPGTPSASSGSDAEVASSALGRGEWWGAVERILFVKGFVVIKGQLPMETQANAATSVPGIPVNLSVGTAPPALWGGKGVCVCGTVGLVCPWNRTSSSH